MDINHDEEALMHRALNPQSFAALKENEWIRLKRKIAPRYTLIRWTMAAASLLGIMTFSLLMYYSPDKTAVKEEVLAVVTPGEYKAELLLPDGKSIPLQLENNVIHSDLTHNLQTDSIHGLNYSNVRLLEESDSLLYHTLKVPTGGFYPMELSDGTRVWLNAASELRFPVKFARDVREVYLKGEGYFEVTKDLQHPFIVHLEQSYVTVLGTSFNIHAYEEEGKIYTTLKTGSVAFFSKKTAQQVLLQPGRQSEMDIQSGNISVKEVDTDVYTSWKEGTFYFKGMTLDEIMRVIARWYQVEVFFRNPSLKSERYNGKIPMYSGIDDVLRKIEISGGVRFEMKGKNIAVIEK
jgi:hypothetical protein